MSLRTVEAHQRFSLSARILTMKMLMIMIIMLMTFMNRCCLYSFNLSALIFRLIGKSHTKSQAVLGLGSGCGCGSLDSINSLAKVTDGCIGDQCVWLPQPRATSHEPRAWSFELVAHGSLAWQIESATRRWRRQLPVPVSSHPGLTRWYTHTDTITWESVERVHVDA